MNEKEIDCFYNQHYFNINKKIQIYAGLWPFKSHLNKLTRQIIMYFILSILAVPLGNGIITWCGVNVELCCENLSGSVYLVTMLMKYSIALLSEKKLKKIYELLAKNWLKMTNPEENAILKEYARQGRVKTIFYLAYVVSAALGFSQLPMIPKVLDLILPLNESRSTILFIKAGYMFDPYKHYFKIYIYYTLFASATVFVISGLDTTYTIIVHQILGTLSIVKYRLYLATLSFDPIKDINYDLIIDSIKLHKEALQFIEFIEASFSIYFLALMGSTVLFISIGAVVLISQMTDQRLDTFRFMMLVFGAIVHFSFNSWPGQKLIDHSEILFISTYENEWYNISERSKKLIKIMMLRCKKTSVFTAGGLYTMNFENFGAIMKTAMSFCTCFMSLR